MPSRYVPELTLPPYSYVTGEYPHPIADPAGHMAGQTEPAVPQIDPARWLDSQTYLYGVDLFNHGYYWEAHEAWEQLWHACNRRGLLADFFKGLIHLAAAGVKARERREEGIGRHAQRAAVLFEDCAALGGGANDRLLGLSLCTLARECRNLAEHPPQLPERPAAPVEILLPLELLPTA